MQSQNIKLINQAIREHKSVSGITIPVESVTLLIIGENNKLFASKSVRDNKVRDENGQVILSEKKTELAFLAGKCQSWTKDNKEDARDYNVKRAKEEQDDAINRIFECPLITLSREMDEESGFQWPGWKDNLDWIVLPVDKDGANSYMLIFFARYESDEKIRSMKFSNQEELQGFVELPYRLEGTIMAVTEPEGCPELRKFFKKILFRFYGETIFTKMVSIH
jgi:hypothetical protein